jgi:hypothetical protein
MHIGNGTETRKWKRNQPYKCGNGYVSNKPLTERKWKEHCQEWILINH